MRWWLCLRGREYGREREREMERKGPSHKVVSWRDMERLALCVCVCVWEGRAILRVDAFRGNDFMIDQQTMRAVILGKVILDWKIPLHWAATAL